METSSPGRGLWGPRAEKPPLGRDAGLGTQPGGADPASGSGGLQVAAGPALFLILGWSALPELGGSGRAGWEALP